MLYRSLKIASIRQLNLIIFSRIMAVGRTPARAGEDILVMKLIMNQWMFTRKSLKVCLPFYLFRETQNFRMNVPELTVSNLYNGLGNLAENIKMTIFRGVVSRLIDVRLVKDGMKRIHLIRRKNFNRKTHVH